MMEKIEHTVGERYVSREKNVNTKKWWLERKKREKALTTTTEATTTSSSSSSSSFSTRLIRLRFRLVCLYANNILNVFTWRENPIVRWYHLCDWLTHCTRTHFFSILCYKRMLLLYLAGAICVCMCVRLRVWVYLENRPENPFRVIAWTRFSFHRQRDRNK